MQIENKDVHSTELKKVNKKMSRKRKAPKKLPVIDPKYKSTIIPKLIPVPSNIPNPTPRNELWAIDSP